MYSENTNQKPWVATAEAIAIEGALDGDKIFIASDGETFVGKVAPRYFRSAAEFPIEQVATHEANQLLSQEWRLIQY